MATLGYFHPLPLMLVVQFAIYLATEPAGEIEFGLVDLILARPLPRHWLVTRSLLMMTIGPVGPWSILAMGVTPVPLPKSANLVDALNERMPSWSAVLPPFSNMLKRKYM